MNTKDLLNYKPYSVVNKRITGNSRDDGYCDVTFENEGLMTVPKGSAPTIVELLNNAFIHGVKMTMVSMKNEQPLNQNGLVQNSVVATFKSTPMPSEEPHPINSYIKK